MHNTSQTHTFIGFDATYEQAELVLAGAPFDGTTSFRPGTRFAPNQIRLDSYGLETYSPYLDLDLEDYALCDIGDVDLPFGNTSRALSTIQDVAKGIIGAHKKPLFVGGEHLISLPIITELYTKYPELHIIHFDAHTDLREDYLGETLSHATVLRRAWDLLGDGRIYQFGIRSGTREEFNWAKSHLHLNLFDTHSLNTVLPKLQGKPVYLTVDLDVLDPSLFAGTGTPEPGGLTFKELMKAFYLIQNLNFVGADIVELSPHYDPSGVSTAVACKVIREVSLMLCKKTSL
ncbi:agmatinase [Sporanaerobium hydrogeniformans]|uniref:Agmatinase n=1 Tax=Sporanaerobium hydrogeniformans TaxID=3072179 RepID=A0AC61D9L5_9FIRM|nr:agmatinase [Sporanaerobium hydrogeniformans]PHV69515.1 agmatinase [Sporanaerobium hydrogeniformans]